jgi:uncharacterized protein YrzB (UPF0473 family)
MAEQNGEPMDSGVDLMTLVDEDGVEHQFEVADSAELDGKSYMALIPVFDDPKAMLDDPGELVILRVMEEDGEEFLEIIEDEAEFDKVGDFFMNRLSESFDFTDEEE